MYSEVVAVSSLSLRGKEWLDCEPLSSTTSVLLLSYVVLLVLIKRSKTRSVWTDNTVEKQFQARKEKKKGTELPSFKSEFVEDSPVASMLTLHPRDVSDDISSATTEPPVNATDR